MYRIRRTFGAGAIVLFLALGAHGQETGSGEPRLLQPNQTGALSRPIGQAIPSSDSAWESGGVLPAAFQPLAAEVDSSSRTQIGAAAKPAPTAGPSRQPSAEVASRPAPGVPPPKMVDTPQAYIPPARIPLPAGSAPLPIGHADRPKPLLAADKGKAESADEGTASRNLDSLLTVVGSLGIVLGLFMVTMWCLRRGLPKAARPLPAEVVEVLGRAPLAGRQQMHLIRFGGKLVLATLSTDGVDAISEITDPVEVDRLMGYCEQTRPSSATASFRGILDRLEDRGIRDTDEPPRPANRGLSSLVGLKGSRGEDEYA